MSIKVLLFYVLLSNSLLLAAQPASVPIVQLQKDINSFLTRLENQKIPHAVQVVSLANGSTLYEKNKNNLLPAASNVKLITAFSALKRLGPNYTFKTKVFYDGAIVGKILKGNLYIKGFGDPLLVSERIWMLTRQLCRESFNVIEGNLFVDDSALSENSFSHRPRRSFDRAFNAPVGALSVNFNTIAVYVRPGRTTGAKGEIFLDPHLPSFQIENHLTTTAKGTNKIWLGQRYRNGQSIIRVRGHILQSSPEKVFYRSIPNPALFAGAVFRKFLEEEGITVRGLVSGKEVPQNAREILSFSSPPLSLILRSLNKISNNFLADQILQVIGGESYGYPSSFAKGLRAIHETLDEIGVSTKEYHIVNGSGLSPVNKLSPQAIIRVLQEGYRDFRVSSEYVSSLGIGGVDGTVRDRFLRLPFGQLRAKTGSLLGISALSGYLTTRDGEILAFSILIEDKKNRASYMQDIQEKIGIRLSQFSREAE